MGGTLTASVTYSCGISQPLTCTNTLNGSVTGNAVSFVFERRTDWGDPVYGYDKYTHGFAGAVTSSSTIEGTATTSYEAHFVTNGGCSVVDTTGTLPAGPARVAF